jgi:hypothetical protein
MEKRLEDFITQVEKVSYMRNLDEANPIVLRFSHPSISKVTAIVCAQAEPTKLILPLNVVWINLDPQSDNYRNALQRVSKNGVAPFEQEWTVLAHYDDVFSTQNYDATDSALLTSSETVSVATLTDVGTVRLSAVSATPESPVVVGEGDARLDDPRTPTAHSHEQLPASALRTQSTNVIISGAVRPTAGSILFATSATTAEWRAVKSTDIVS